MDIVYTLGGGSKWDNNEIRYSLRSIEKHLSGYRNIYIVGIKPDFLQNIIHIPYEDVLPFKEINIFKKVLYASQYVKEISDNFLFFNDDHFLLVDFNAKSFPYFYKCSLEESIDRKWGGRYKTAMANTKRVLEEKGYPSLNYDGHQPIIYNKSNIIELGHMYDWSIDIGYVLKSLYSNTFGINGVKEPDCKINACIEAQFIREDIQNKKVFSIGDVVLQPTPEAIKSVLDELYPNKSKFEV